MITNKKRTGQAVVEMALVLPVFIVLLIGIFDFARAFHCWSNLNHQCVQAARAGTKRINSLIARNVFSATTHPDIEEVQKEFWRYRSPLMPEDKYSNIAYTGIGTADREVEVRASFNLSLYTPLLGGLIGGSSKDGALTINAIAKDRKE